MIVEAIVICGLWTRIKLFLKSLFSHICFFLLISSPLSSFTRLSSPGLCFPSLSLPILHRLASSPNVKAAAASFLFFLLRMRAAGQHFLPARRILFSLARYHCVWSPDVLLLRLLLSPRLPLVILHPRRFFSTLFAALFPHARRRSPCFLPAHLQCLAVLWLAC